MRYPLVGFLNAMVLHLILILIEEGFARKWSNTIFDQNFYVTWGFDHVSSHDRDQDIQLLLDRYSGSGFASKLNYGSGIFSMKIKVPGNDSAGVITAFYLTSEGDEHDELDFEFLGDREGRPYTLQTNVFANGEGNREERLHLWFDPISDYHTYGILWNEHQIAFYVDEIPVGVFKNSTDIGVGYPSRPMRVEVSLYDGDDWATDGGRTKIDWSHSPFSAYFRGFQVSGCETARSCYSSKYWWNSQKYWRLNYSQQTELHNVRKNYITYDYCSDRSRYLIIPKECAHRSFLKIV